MQEHRNYLRMSYPMRMMRADYVGHEILKPYISYALREFAYEISRWVSPKNRNKAVELFLYGTDTHYTFANRDGYDLSFLNILAYYCEGDPEEMSRVFDLSALRRKKWDEEKNYRDISIAKAVRNYKRHLYRMKLRKARLAALAGNRFYRKVWENAQK